MTMWSEFQGHEGRKINKWVQYFPVYERYLSRFRNQSIFVLEIGVSLGGSMELWRKYFGPLATIVGIDIDEECRKHEINGVHIEIGSQADEFFLAQLIEKYCIPDIVIDDGSHQMAHLKKTFEYPYPKMSRSGIYLIEDLHTCYWTEFGGGGKESFIEFAKNIPDYLNAKHSRGMVAANGYENNTFGISFFDSMIVVGRGNANQYAPISAGGQWIKKQVR
ncbi:class I SAM-dependent methyltransferase [Polynucleobacter paneuropaeus]|nr:class I SAM-dependent methyltransferase [Polynucleobacter paneuropaeus]MBT8539684.1 class I SAM-dependent methyltransferase [Polynucleobacter paneuropaeus]